MYKEINFSEFVDEFIKAGRENQFTYAGKVALYEYLIDTEESSETPVILDIIGLCCDFTEYATEEEAKEDYYLDEDEDLSDYTVVIPVDDSRIIIQNF
jgi:uncharacterized alpha/beta hydrolase family protein